MTKGKPAQSVKSKIWATIRVFFLAALFYLGTALIFLGSGFGTSYLVQENAERATSGLTAKKADLNKKRRTTYDASKTESISTTRIWQSRQTKAYAIGRIAIPAVNIHNPLFAGYGKDNQNLEYGVVTCLPDRAMGGHNNYVLAGHYMGAHGPAVLDNLHLAKRGDLIYVTDLHDIYAYKIRRISFAIKPTQVEVENNVANKRMITLITCSDFNTSKYGYGEHRTVVQGNLVSRVKATSKNLLAAELTDRTDNSKTKRQAALPAKKGHKTINRVERVRPAARSQFFQSTAFIRGAIAVFTATMLVLIAWRTTRIWLPRRRK